MKIEYIDKFDLYMRGNYIGSFNSYDEIVKFFNEKEDKVKGDGWNTWTSMCSEDNFINSMNNEEYSVIQSKHLKFS